MKGFDVDFDDEVADRFLNLLAPTTELILPSSNVLALPAAVEEIDGEYSIV